MQVKSIAECLETLEMEMDWTGPIDKGWRFHLAEMG